MKVKDIIGQAKTKYPVSIPFKGFLTEGDVAELEKTCDVHCSSVYMDGTGYYSIRYRKDNKDAPSATKIDDIIREYICGEDIITMFSITK